jgi:hypothetical protein
MQMKTVIYKVDSKIDVVQPVSEEVEAGLANRGMNIDAVRSPYGASELMICFIE